MEDVFKKLDALEEKVRLFSGRYRELNDTHLELQEKYRKAVADLKEKEKELEATKKNIATLTVSSIVQSEEPDEAIKKIDELVREIDRCLALIDK